MGDSTDNSYILIEDSRNLDEGEKEKQSDLRDQSEDASQRTLDRQGIFIEPRAPSAEATAPAEDIFLKRLLDQGGIEIIPGKDTDEELL